MSRLCQLVIVVSVFIIITAPSLSVATRSPVPQKEKMSDENMLVAGNTEFALDLYRQLQKEFGKEGEEYNLFFSPYSISTALAMTYAGARGNTEAQMANVLHFPQARLFKSGPRMNRTIQQTWPQERLHKAFSQLQQGLSADAEDCGYELHVANALWGQTGYEFLPEFIRLTQKHYGAGLQKVDFIRATEQARQGINTWVEEKTNRKIKELIQPGVLNSLTRLVLTNAIYFKGNWAHQFKEKSTKESPFYITPGKIVQTPLMMQREDYKYADLDDVQVLELPYKSGQLSMIVLLPKTRDGLAEMEKSLTPDKLSNCLKKLRTAEVVVYLPKFKLTSKFSLSKILSALGMLDAFSSSKANFSGMTQKEEWFISAVLHKAYVDVNEEGTEAATATGVAISATSIPRPPRVFRADHPFLFLIRDTRTDSILFMGRLANPQAAK